MGPICVAEHLAPYLPGHSVVELGRREIHPCSFCYSLGQLKHNACLVYLHQIARERRRHGMQRSYAILNANYLKSHLERVLQRSLYWKQWKSGS